ncbi:hypothetical protein HDU89_006402 [Geranomyces variabilis]|nr:hypothetical protein HDU89_006402 [Geranomyces variabilis]
MDVIVAYLNALMDKRVVMQDLRPGAPSGALVKLIKSLYRLKQAAHLWNETVDTV